MGLRAVSDSLWRERQLLELLQFKFEQERLLLQAGRTQWLSHATREVEMVLEQLRRTELERAARVASACEELGLPPLATLRQLAAAAPEPWDGVLRRHRDAMATMADEIATLVAEIEELLARGREDAQSALGRVEAARSETR